MKINHIYNDDCLKIMKTFKDNSIDMILCDLPYGTTACSWDTIIPFKPLWKQYERIIKNDSAIVLMASQPFTTDLINSNRKWFKYIWYWEKEKGTGFANSGKMPLKILEDCCIFYKKLPYYNPPKKKLDKPYYRRMNDNTKSKSTRMTSKKIIGKMLKYEYETPVNLLYYSRDNATQTEHPTQKPVALFEYLIKTYTNKNDLVLDNCLGSGTTAVACQNLHRNFIGIEISEKYCAISRERLRQKPLL